MFSNLFGGKPGDSERQPTETPPPKKQSIVKGTKSEPKSDGPAPNVPINDAPQRLVATDHFLLFALKHFTLVLEDREMQLPRDVIQEILLAHPRYTLGWDVDSLTQGADGLLGEGAKKATSEQFGWREGKWENGGMTFNNMGQCWLNRYMVREPIKYPYIVEVEYAICLLTASFVVAPMLTSRYTLDSSNTLMGATTFEVGVCTPSTSLIGLNRRILYFRLLILRILRWTGEDGFSW